MNVIKKGATILITSILIGYFLLSISYLVPTENMKYNLSEDIDSFIQEDIYKEVNKYGNYGLLDNFTDSIMISHAINTNSNSIFIQSLENQRFYQDNIDYRISIKDTINNYGEFKTINYNRYWHGYLIFLKPILYFTNYYSYRYINLIVQTLLLIICVLLIIKKLNILYGIGFLGSIVILQPYIVSMSLQFSSVYYITLISSIFILLKDKITKENSLYLFMLIGISTSYFDLLTYPIITFGIPILIYLSLNKDTCFKQFFKLGAAWAFGYLGMWLGKWLLTSLVLNTNIIEVVLNTIQMRTSSTAISKKISRFGTVISNFKYGLNENVFIINFIILVLLSIFIVLNKFKFKLRKESLIPILITLVSPVIWFILTANHASIHYFYTYRSIAISVFAAYVLILNNIKLGEKNE